MSNPVAARLAEVILAAMKDQPLTDEEAGRRVGLLTAGYERRAGHQPSAEKLAELRERAKSEPFNLADLGRRIEHITGKPFPLAYVSRRLNCSRPLITIADDLYDMCEALGLDPAEEVAKAINARRLPVNGAGS